MKLIRRRNYIYFSF